MCCGAFRQGRELPTRPIPIAGERGATDHVDLPVHFPMVYVKLGYADVEPVGPAHVQIRHRDRSFVAPRSSKIVTTHADRFPRPLAEPAQLAKILRSIDFAGPGAPLPASSASRACAMSAAATLRGIPAEPSNPVLCLPCSEARVRCLCGNRCRSPG